MSEFINTIELLGDEAVTDSIIEGTITEFRDNTIAYIAPFAFTGCLELAVVEVPNATVQAPFFENHTKLTTFVAKETLGYDTLAFGNCSSLTRYEVGKVEALGQRYFEGCSSLEILRLASTQRIIFHYQGWFNRCTKLSTLIIDVPELCTVGSNPLPDTPIASGNGYIYVPRALVDSYKSATNWSTYANQIRAIEDYPEITGG